jgi:uncharacterized protein YbjT (DUF2867 family)
MRVVIAGGHGKIALLLERLLAERGDQVAGLIRNPAHAGDVRAAGAEAVLCDLESASAGELAELLAGVRRFVQISSMGAGQPPRPGTDEVWAAYITAKTAAETDLSARDLDWTILRPGRLTDAPPAGAIRLAASPVPAGAIPRADVAAVIIALLDEPGTWHQTLELTSGDTPIAAAVGAL